MPCRTAPAWPERAAAADVDAHVEFGGRLGDGQRLQYLGAQVFDREIILKRTVVHHDLAGTGSHADTRDRGLAPAGSGGIPELSLLPSVG